MLEIVLLMATGVATGFLNTLAGGGSMLSVPVMIFLGVPGTVANGTNRIAILPQNIAAVWVFYRKGFANFRLSLSLAACTIPGTIIGAYYAAKIPHSQFNGILAVVMILILIVMALPQKKEHQINPKNLSRTRFILGHLCMIFIGFWGGFIHIGVGFLLMPILHRILLMDLITTNSHKVFIILCYTIVALFIFHSQLQLIWQYGLSLAVGTSIGAWLAAHFQIRQGVGVIRIALNAIVIAFIIKLLLF